MRFTFGGPGLLLAVLAAVRTAGAADGPPRAVADRLGSAHVAGRYHLGTDDFLNDGAAQIQKLGSRVIKVWFTNRSAHDYPFNSRWPEVKSLVELAQTPYFRALFDRPFTTYILVAYGFGRDMHYWRHGVSPAEADDEARQFEALTRHLLTTYVGTGKTFVIQHWEGDWAARGHFDAKRAPSAETLQGMVRWLNARQEGVDRARRAVAARDVHVFHAAEVNRVADAMAGMATVTNDVVPRTHCDLYSYSSYDSLADDGGKTLRVALDYIAAKAPDSPAFGARNVYVGEFGVPENERGTEKTVAILRGTIETALDWGCPYVVYWEVYDNERRASAPAAAAGPVREESCRGFWLVKPSGEPAAAWHLLRSFLKDEGRDGRSREGRNGP
jgi:hypothetical protein